MAVVALMAVMAGMAETGGADSLATKQLSLCQVRVIRGGPDGCTPNGYALPLPAAALPMKGSQTRCMTQKRHLLLQPPVRREGRIKVRKASRQRSVFLAVNAVNATKRRPLRVDLSSNHNLHPHSHTEVPLAGSRIGAECRSVVGGTHVGGTSGPFGPCPLSMTAAIARPTTRTGQGDGTRHES